jgi:predicted ester cyclase
MGAEENKAVIRRIAEVVVNQKKLAMVDELFSKDYQPHPSMPGHTHGPQHARRNFSRLHKGFPDFRVTIDSMVAEGDMVAARLTLSGTHLATGKHARWPAKIIAHLADGKVTEDWRVVDSRQLETQRAKATLVHL